MRTRTRSRLESKRSGTLLENLEPRLLLSSTPFVQMGTLRMALLKAQPAAVQQLPAPESHDVPLPGANIFGQLPAPESHLAGDTQVPPPESIDGHPVTQITWNGQTLDVIENQYEAMVTDAQVASVKTAEDFTALAAGSGLTVTDVTVLPGPGRFGFMVQGATPEQVAAWGTSAADSVKYVEPISLSMNAFLGTTAAASSATTGADGNSFGTVLWHGQTYTTVTNQYLALVKSGVDFASFAAAHGLAVSQVRDFGMGLVTFYNTTLTPDQVTAWGDSFPDAIVSMEPNFVTQHPYDVQAGDNNVPMATGSGSQAVGATPFIQMGTLRVELTRAGGVR